MVILRLWLMVIILYVQRKSTNFWYTRDDEIMEVKASEIRYTDSFLLKK